MARKTTKELVEEYKRARSAVSEKPSIGRFQTTRDAKQAVFDRATELAAILTSHAEAIDVICAEWERVTKGAPERPELARESVAKHQLRLLSAAMKAEV